MELISLKRNLIRAGSRQVGYQSLMHPGACSDRWYLIRATCGVVSVVALGIFLACTQEESENREPVSLDSKPKTVVFIMIDTLRSDHVGVYGGRQGLTPNIDALGAEGVVFDEAVATSSWTRSSIASILTSRYATEIGVLGRTDAIADSLETMVEVLRDHGFRTQGVTTNKNAGAPFGFAQGYEKFVTPELTGGYPEDVTAHIAEGVTAKALELVDDLPGDEPLFLYVHYIDPHDPYLPHPELLDPLEPGGRFDGSRRQLDSMDKLDRDDITSEDIARIRHLYAGEVAYCDKWVGRLLQGLKDRGLYDDALVIITSDHGEGLWDHDLRAHGRDLYEEIIQVPLLIRHPSAASGGRRISTPVSHIDLATTILGLLEIEPPETYDGRDLSSELRGKAPSESIVYSEIDLDGFGSEVARRGNAKLIRDRKRAPRQDFVEFYDLSKDPRELRDISSLAIPARLELEKELDEWFAAQTANATETRYINLAKLDQATIRNLQALGYLDTEVADSERLLAVLDFSDLSRKETHSAQLVSGFYGLEGKRRWMAGLSRIELGRRGEEKVWRIAGWINLDLHERESLSILVRVNGGAPVTYKIEESGSFLLEGDLPGNSSDVVQLDLECDHDFLPRARPLCVVVRSIGIY